MNFEKNKISYLKEYTPIIFAIYIIFSLFEVTVIPSVFPWTDAVAEIIRYICYLFFAVKIFCDIIHQKKISIVMVGALLLSVFVVLSARQMGLLFIVLILSALNGVNHQKTVKCAFLGVCIIFLITLFSSLLGLLPNWIYYRADGITERHSLGFIYPTDMYSIYLLIVLMCFYLYRSHIKYYVLAILEAVNISLFLFTDGRLSFLLVNIVLLIILLYKIFKNNKIFINLKNGIYNNKTIRIFAVCLPIILYILCLVLILLFRQETSFGEFVDSILSHRLRYSNDAFNNYPVRLFGTNVDWQGWGGYNFSNTNIKDFKYNFVDISYIFYLFDYGVVATFGILLAYSWLIKRCFTNKNGVLLSIVGVILIWSIVEPYLFSISRNVFIIFFAPLIQRYFLPLKFLQKSDK